jgi:exosortase
MAFSNNNLETSGALVATTKVSKLLGLGFLLVCVLPFVVAWDSTKVLFTLVIYNETFSQIPLIPVVSAFLIYGDRKRIFSEISFGWILGAALITPAVILLVVERLNLWHFDSANRAALLMFGAVFLWIGAFALFWGRHAFRAACFSLLFLLFAVPIPEPVLSKVIFLLQKGSSDAAEVFFRLGGVPYLRQGFVFQLPGVAIRVAEECSGIRSTLALLITTVLAGHLFLKSSWKKLLLCVVVVPLAILKNGLRIMTLSTLAIYVNPGFLHGDLHKHGGIVFFVIALVPLALLLMWLQRSESPSSAVATGS